MVRLSPVRVRHIAAIVMMAAVATVVPQVPVAEVVAPLVLVVGLVIWYRATNTVDRKPSDDRRSDNSAAASPGH